MSEYTGMIENRHDNIVTITFNRPDKSNAFNDEFIAHLSKRLSVLEEDAALRALIFRGNGKHFSAGGDLRWMQTMANKSIADNTQDALQLALLLQQINEFPHPTIAVVNGRAMGGGVGLVACCDCVVSDADALFCFSEVKLGLVPATIAPFIIQRIGVTQARRYFLTAELISAPQALQIGLINHIANEDNNSDNIVEHWLAHLMKNSPEAIKTAKQLALRFNAHDPNIAQKTAELLANVRCSDSAKEGIDAFLNKREPNWIKNNV